MGCGDSSLVTKGSAVGRAAANRPPSKIEVERQRRDSMEKIAAHLQAHGIDVQAIASRGMKNASPDDVRILQAGIHQLDGQAALDGFKAPGGRQAALDARASMNQALEKAGAKPVPGELPPSYRPSVFVEEIQNQFASLKAAIGYEAGHVLGIAGMMTPLEVAVLKMQGNARPGDPAVVEVAKLCGLMILAIANGSRGEHVGNERSQASQAIAMLRNLSGACNGAAAAREDLPPSYRSAAAVAQVKPVSSFPLRMAGGLDDPYEVGSQPVAVGNRVSADMRDALARGLRNIYELREKDLQPLSGLHQKLKDCGDMAVTLLGPVARKDVLDPNLLSPLLNLCMTLAQAAKDEMGAGGSPARREFLDDVLRAASYLDDCLQEAGAVPG